MTLLRRTLTLAAALSLALTLSIDEAQAGKKGKKGKANQELTVELTGIHAFDDVFTRVKAIDERLKTSEKLLRSSRKDLVKALELDDGTPLKDGLAELKKRADGKLSVVMKGNKPSLQASDAVPSNVQGAIDAVNRMTDGIATSIEELTGIPAEVKEILAASQAFPAKLKEELTSDPTAKLSQAPKILKTLKGNTKVTTSLPDRSQKVVKRMNDLVQVLRSEFPVTEGGEEPVASGPGGASSPAGEPTEGSVQGAGADVSDPTPGIRGNPNLGNVADKLAGRRPEERRERRKDLQDEGEDPAEDEE